METTEWLTIGEYFRKKGMDFPVESFKIYARKMKIPHKEGSRPYKYREDDLERVYEEMCRNSLYMRWKMLR